MLHKLQEHSQSVRKSTFIYSIGLIQVNIHKTLFNSTIKIQGKE